jgi:hypothetical protein
MAHPEREPTRTGRDLRRRLHGVRARLNLSANDAYIAAIESQPEDSQKHFLALLFRRRWPAGFTEWGQAILCGRFPG